MEFELTQENILTACQSKSQCEHFSTQIANIINTNPSEYFNLIQIDQYATYL